MDERERRLKPRRICFTGHRPEKLKRSKQDIIKDLESQIRRAIADGLNVFISGMSRGVDLWAAKIILKIRDSGENVKLICAVPYKDFEINWSYEWQQEYRNVLKSADFIKYICNDYNDLCFKIRNEWMVNHSSQVIAVFNGRSGGTKNTINYAKCIGVTVVYIGG